MITWNGVTSDSIGVIVERMPDRFLPARRFAPHAVPGRNGDVLIVDESFPNIDQVYEVYLSGESRGGMPEVAHAAAAWLTGPKGYGRLTDSYDATGYREAFLAEGFGIENVLNQFGRCEITFSCKPQTFLYSGTVPVTLTVNGDTTITNPTAFPARPNFRVRGTGTITIEDREIIVYSNPGLLLINCETMEATDGTGAAANTRISCLDFPVLNAGDTVITLDGFSSADVVPHWWKL